MGSEHQFRNVALAGVAVVGAYKLWKHARDEGKSEHISITANTTVEPEYIVQSYVEEFYKKIDPNIEIHWVGLEAYNEHWTTKDPMARENNPNLTIPHYCKKNPSLGDRINGFINFRYRSKEANSVGEVRDGIVLIRDGNVWTEAKNLVATRPLGSDPEYLAQLAALEQEERVLAEEERVLAERARQREAREEVERFLVTIDTPNKAYVKINKITGEHQTLVTELRDEHRTQITELKEKLKDDGDKIKNLERRRDEAAESYRQLHEKHDEELARIKTNAAEHLYQLQERGAKRLSVQYEPIIEFLKGRNSDNHILLEIDEELADFFGGTNALKTFAVARQCGVRVTDASVIEQAGDLAAILTNMAPGDILCVNNFHQLGEGPLEILQPTIDKQEMDLVIGEGPAARAVRIDLPPFTIMGIIPKGEKTILTGMDHYRLDNGKVVPVSS